MLLWKDKANSIREVGQIIKENFCDLDNWLYDLLNDDEIGHLIVSNEIDFDDYDYEIIVETNLINNDEEYTIYKFEK